MINKDRFDIKELKLVYEIINNDEIEDKISEIEKIDTIDKFEKALEHKYYTDLKEEIKVIQNWYIDYLEEKMLKEDHSRQYIEKKLSKLPYYEKETEYNQVSPKHMARKIEELLYLNECYKSGNLNENTFYKVFRNTHGGSYGFTNGFNYIYKSKSVDITDPKIKELFDNMSEICRICNEMLTGQTLENLKYRRHIDNFLENNNYLENYQYAEYIIKSYIEDEISYKTLEFYKKYGIDDEKLKYSIEVISFLNPVLYKEYLEKSKINSVLRRNNNYEAFLRLSERITENIEKGTELPVEEFLKEAPFKSSGYNYINKISDFIKNKRVLGIIKEYLYRNKLEKFNYMDKDVEINIIRIINGYRLSKEDNANIFKIMDVRDLPYIKRIYNIITDEYINGKYDMNKINDEYNKKQEDIKKLSKEIPYVYIKEK